MKTPHPIDLLNKEADRFNALARDFALQNLIKPNPEKEFLARTHLIRAETFRTAANMMNPAFRANS